MISSDPEEHTDVLCPANRSGIQSVMGDGELSSLLSTCEAQTVQFKAQGSVHFQLKSMEINDPCRKIMFAYILAD